ncbi:unnamed protein product [Somion occarium]|uniref:Protein kinase domain-containing protein n=1 Tax=Somion occarium TaxID=3059160 RepID=A0ABP1D5L9_9APHY
MLSLADPQSYAVVLHGGHESVQVVQADPSTDAVSRNDSYPLTPGCSLDLINERDEGYGSDRSLSPSEGNNILDAVAPAKARHEAELLFENALQSPETAEELIKATRGELATALQQLLQEKLDESRVDSTIQFDFFSEYDDDKFVPSENRTFLRYLLKLSRNPGFVPTSFHVKGVKCGESEPTTFGGCSDVFKGDLNGEVVALKQLRFNKSMNVDKSSKEFLREAIVWRQLRHPFILPFLGIDIETSRGRPPKPRMVSPWMVNGNVIDAAKRMTLQQESVPVDRWLLEAAKGVEYLHKQEVVHGDIRGANILVNESNQVQITDFGLSTITDATTITLGSHKGGTLQWMSPELLEGKEIRRPTKECDVYSFGCFCVELYTLRTPYPLIRVQHQVYLHVCGGNRPSRPTIPRVMSDTLWELVQRCWTSNYSARPSISCIIENLAYLGC